MSPLLAAVFGLFLYVLVRILNITHPAAAPLIYAKDRSSQFVQSVLEMCPILHQPYIPPFLWGKSGHIQTIVYARMGRLNITVPDGVRHSTVMPDGANLTFDLYEPTRKHPTGEEHCIIFCPGIGNNSESPYIQSLVHHSQQHGYISVVLNHLGSLPKVPLTSPRLFSYGGTEELAAVRSEVERIHPGCKLILVGCSMGANIVVKYLGESREHQKGILAGISVNQGYNVCRAVPMLKSWHNMGRFYVYVMTQNQKRIIRLHREQLLSEENKLKHNIDEKQLFSSTSLDDLDKAFFIKMFGYDSLDQFYENMSSYRYLPNIQIPLLILNAEDDPVVPTDLLDHPMEAANTQPYTLFVVTKHGGHLGFYEKGFLRPSEHTWMDRLILEYSDAITRLYHAGSVPLLGGTDTVRSVVDPVLGGCGDMPDKQTHCPALVNNNISGGNSLRDFPEDGYVVGNGKTGNGLEALIGGDGKSSVSGVSLHLNTLESNGRHRDGEGLPPSRGSVLEALRKSTNSAQL